MNIGFARAAIVLGLLTGIGPVAIDMYLPAMPSIAVDLSTTAMATQMSLMAYFVAVALFQSVYGPLSDMFGRKTPLFAGLSLFTLASIGCAMAPNIETLIAFRFVQGIGGCACMVISRAVVRDLYTGLDAARLMALIMLVFSMGPILAPFFGSIFNDLFGWRVIFLAMVVIGLAGIVLVQVALPETRPPEKRLASNMKTAIASYRELLTDPRFVGTAMIGSAGLACFFAYLAASPFIYIDHFGLSPSQFAMVFALNAIGFFSFAQLNGRIGARIGLRRMVRYAISVMSIMVLGLLVYFVAGGNSMLVLIGALFFIFGALGLVVPASTVLALERFGRTAGTASALLGTIQFALGAVAIIAISLAGKGEIIPMIGVISGFAVFAWLMSRVTLRGDYPVPAK